MRRRYLAYAMEEGEILQDATVQALARLAPIRVLADGRVFDMILPKYRVPPYRPKRGPWGRSPKNYRRQCGSHSRRIRRFEKAMREDAW